MGKKILLADDSITIQKVIELTFSDEDFEVVTVGNGRLALEKLSEVRPDIVLCDIIMPEKDGYEVCDQIKKNAAFSHVPVLLLTGAFEPFDQERAARAGYDGSLAKPFEPETLIAKVRDLLARAPQRAASPAPPPVVPFTRPAVSAPAPAFVPPPPPPPAATTVADPGPAFIPDEPFDEATEDLDLEPAPPPPPAPLHEAPAPLAAMSEEETATLLTAPSEPPEPPEPESTRTVMFKATDLPWNVAPAPVPVPAAPKPAPVPEPPPAPAFVREPESEFDPEALDGAQVVEETAVFEEVVEEIDYDAAREAAFDAVEPADAGATMMFTGASTLPPSTTHAVESPANTASFEAMEEAALEEPELEPLPAPEPEPEPLSALPPAPPMPTRPSMPALVRVVEPPVVAPAPPPAPPAPPAAPPAPQPPVPPAAVAPPPPPPPPVAVAATIPEPPPVQSFADLVPNVEETIVPPASQTAAFSVPVEMVEKIAQRVVAQISEKAVREIAWEVIPDLAEALIKQEIERLKAELQKI